MKKSLEERLKAQLSPKLYREVEAQLRTLGSMVVGLQREYSDLASALRAALSDRDKYHDEVSRLNDSFAKERYSLELELGRVQRTLAERTAAFNTTSERLLHLRGAIKAAASLVSEPMAK